MQGFIEHGGKLRKVIGSDGYDYLLEVSQDIGWELKYEESMWFYKANDLDITKSYYVIGVSKRENTPVFPSGLSDVYN